MKLILITLALTLASCAALSPAIEPACSVIDVAHNACEYYLIEYRDASGNVRREYVRRSELRDAAERARAQRGGN